MSANQSSSVVRSDQRHHGSRLILAVTTLLVAAAIMIAMAERTRAAWSNWENLGGILTSGPG